MVGFVLTVISIIVSTCGLLFNYFRYRKEDRFRQSNKITCWVNSVNPKNLSTDVIVLNQDVQPVYNVFVYLVSNVQEIKGCDFSSIDNQGTRMHDSINVLPPGKIHITLGFRGAAMGNVHDEVGMYFTTSNGLEWSRQGNGKLTTCMYLKELSKIGVFLHHV